VTDSLANEEVPQNAAPSAGTDAADNPADISSAEVDALLSKVRSGDIESGVGVAAPAAVRAYDLAARDKIFRGRMPALDSINERWVGEFEQELKERIKRPLEVAVQKAEVMGYGEWLASLPTPSSFNIYNVKPWRGPALLTVTAQLLYLLVDSYYGGGAGRREMPARLALTRTEERLNSIVVDSLIRHFREAFKPIMPLDFELLRTEVNPHYASIATPSETVLVSRLIVKLNDAEGELALVFPLSLLDPVRGKLDEGLRTASAESQARWLQSLRQHLESTDVDLSGVFLNTSLSIKELLRMKPGDILPIEMPKTAALYSGGRALLRGKFGRSRGYNAVKVAESAQQRRNRQK
jgi:flagellar motor switch protein FliM